ncbi:unnamed protein product [Phytophthora fragariaefolia]|uniref:Unnamed protein product n=1 Tax=Phytophthora fragariaefolia TaxID=1490495 RepID=A0A9W6YRU5_9STRA|nr:unnamed protein product [Phytophthora fragariaefolia]
MAGSRFSAVLALVVLLVVTVQANEVQKTGTTADWPSLRFHFTLKRDTMKIHGQSQFDIYGNPILKKDTVLYDAFATFTEHSTLYNYTLLHGIAYSSSVPYTGSPAGDSKPEPSVACLDEETAKLPSINSIVAAINGAAAAKKTAGITMDCSGGNLFKVMVNRIEFALCATGSTGFKMQGNDMDVSVEFLESHIDILVPKLAEKKRLQCPSVASPNTITPIGKAVLTGQAMPHNARNLKAAGSFSIGGKPTCSCKSKPRPCVFIHGLGVSDETPQNEAKFVNYWSDHLTGHTPCCSSLNFAHLNTVNYTWTSAELQEKVCNRALSASNTSTNSAITDTIVVTHSMGNLMFAGALANAKCSLDSSSTWVGMAGPMKGSMCSDFVQDSCAGKTNVIWEKVGSITGRCPPNTGLKSLGYEGENYSTTELNAAYAAAQEVYRTKVSALMCGKSYSGLTSKYQAQFWGLGSIVPHKSSQNDGMVEFQSCAAGFPESKFGNNFRNQFYVTKLNHYDMQFRAGDSVMDEQKMPVKWFECLL